jgi:hypothetical protein
MAGEVPSRGARWPVPTPTSCPVHTNGKRWYALCMDRAVAYLRVSTKQQQRSGLGIEAQRATIARFVDAENIRIIAEYVEAARAPTRLIVGRSSPPLWRPPSLPSAAS